MVIHEKGPKAERDRRRSLAKYDELSKHFGGKRIAPEVLARMNNRALYQAGEDLWNSQSVKAKQKYAESAGIVPRANPLAFRWFVSDRVRLFQATGWRWWVVILMSPIRYPGFLVRSKKAMPRA